MRNHINKNDFISRFNLHVPLKLCNRYLCNNIYYRYLDIDDMHILNTLMSKKYINKKIINIKTKLDHDGYDQYGPESNLYDLYVYYQKGYNMYYDNYHREYWYHGEDNEPYELW